MKRIVEPELLDELSPDDVGAIQSRGDLRRVNFFMGNVATLARLLRESFPENPPKRIVELGAGDGTFALKLAQQFSSRWKDVEMVLVDKQNLVSPKTKNDFRKMNWRLEPVCSDVFEWLASCDPSDCIFTNLFLHHFENEKLSGLLRMAKARTKVFLACEPARSSFGIFGTKLLWIIGCNAVTSHDAVVSVRAGFSGGEISSLWPQREKWRFVERPCGLFSHSFSANL